MHDGQGSHLTGATSEQRPEGVRERGRWTSLGRAIQQREAQVKGCRQARAWCVPRTAGRQVLEKQSEYKMSQGVKDTSGWKDAIAFH